MRTGFGRRAALALLLVAAGTCGPAALAAEGTGIGVVLMHGKAGHPRTVGALARTLESRGMQVANLEMPWSGRREYDVDLNAGVEEVTRALQELRAKGATRLFVAGHSQGALFAVVYGGRHKVDGIVAVAPGSQVDTPGFTRSLSEEVATARRMRDEGRGAEKAGFADYEGRRKKTRIRTSADSYLSWFDPQGELTTGAFGRVKPGTPVLYVAPTNDNAFLRSLAASSFAALPEHPRKRLLEPQADHMGAPAAAAQDIAAWIGEIAVD